MRTGPVWLATVLVACGPASIAADSGETGFEETGDGDGGPGDGDGDPGDGDGDPGDGDGDGDGDPCPASLPELIVSDDANLEPYACLVEITGSLEIIDNTQVTSIAELFPALETVGDVLRVANNQNLPSVDLQLDSVGSIEIYGNPDLVEFDSLATIQSIDVWRVSANPALGSLAGFSGLTTAEQLAISGAPLIDSLDDLAQLTSVGSLSVSGLDITSLAGLEQAKVHRSLYVSLNDNLTSLDGLGGFNFGELAQIELRHNPVLVDLDLLTSAQSQAVECALLLENVPLIDSLTPFASVCPGASLDLVVSGLPLLQNLDGLAPGPDAGLLEFTNNAALVDLGALAPITTAEVLHIGSECTMSQVPIGGNASLTTLAGLESLGSVEQLEIADNDALVDMSAISTMQVTAWGAIWLNDNLPEDQVAAFVAQAGGSIDTSYPMGMCPQ